MPNGKPPKTTGEHLVSLYGYVQGFKRQIDHLHQDVGKLEKKNRHSYLLDYWWCVYNYTNSCRFI